jgi:hypothetical protein
VDCGVALFPPSGPAISGKQRLSVAGAPRRAALTAIFPRNAFCRFNGWVFGSVSGRHFARAIGCCEASNSGRFAARQNLEKSQSDNILAAIK